MRSEDMTPGQRAGLRKYFMERQKAVLDLLQEADSVAAKELERELEEITETMQSLTPNSRRVFQSPVLSPPDISVFVEAMDDLVARLEDGEQVSDRNLISAAISVVRQSFALSTEDLVILHEHLPKFKRELEKSCDTLHVNFEGVSVGEILFSNIPTEKLVDVRESQEDLKQTVYQIRPFVSSQTTSQAPSMQTARH